MLWLVLFGVALMGTGILLIVLQRENAKTVVQDPPTVAFAAVAVDVTPGKPRPLGATPPGWCPPSI
jgi:hypothetical protein